MAITTYGSISPRTAAYAAKQFLRAGLPFLVLEKFGQATQMPKNKTDVIKFRRYDSLDATPNALTEGVTPSAKSLTATDVSATLTEYGDRVEISDVVADTHEDPVLAQAQMRLGEQAAEMIEAVRFGVVKAGTSVYYANGAARNAVNTVMTLALQRKIVRAMKRQKASKITTVVRSTPDYGTEAVAPSYVALCHTDCENDIRDMTGFTPAEKYGTITPYESEIGKVEDVRYVTSQVFEPWDDAGGAAGGTVLSTSGTDADVYPILFIGRDAYGLVALKGPNAVTPIIINPTPSDSDPLSQRGHAGWKSYQAACILNDAWLVRAEVAVSV